MNILMIDTSSKNEFVGVLSANKTLSKNEKVDHSHSTTLLMSINNVLKESSLSIHEIDIIGVGIGPGSFTGIRIAVSTARMLSQLINAPLVGVKSQLLHAVSMDAGINSNLLIAIDGKKNRVFGALYKKTGKTASPSEIITPGDYPINFLVSKIDKNNITLAAGDGITAYWDIISKSIDNIRRMDDMSLSADSIALLIRNMYSSGPNLYDDYKKVVPCYSRKSDAEIGLIK